MPNDALFDKSIRFKVYNMRKDSSINFLQCIIVLHYEDLEHSVVLAIAFLIFGIGLQDCHYGFVGVEKLTLNPSFDQCANVLQFYFNVFWFMSEVLAEAFLIFGVGLHRTATIGLFGLRS